ncbi:MULTISPECIES: HdeD family acid-resistance protein [unclassified Roseitalea]|uniref:HdeD family acid-resistance protein n=1 Tax=unclassified Roseitalea TaxID=2639107 RepID=UPI00273EFBAA|nr:MULTISPECIES: HdeD family acid-resistance protein [unclassified Roseitalea]
MNDSARTDPLERTVDVSRHRGLFWFTAVAGIIAGTLATLMPFIATFAANIAFAAVLIALGITQAFAAFRAGGIGRSVGMGLMGLLSVFTGALLVLFPAAGIVALATLLTAYLIVSGVLKSYFAFRLRPQDGWGWMLAGGVASLVLGKLLLTGLPGASFWVLGLFVGIDMLFYSYGLLGLLIATRRRGGDEAAAEGDRSSIVLPDEDTWKQRPAQ